MNIILFKEDELDQPLALKDPRAVHVLRVIGGQAGDNFDVGLVNGPRGKARIVHITKQALELTFTFNQDIPSLYPVTMLVGLPRPASARRILKDLTSLGAARLHFVTTDKGDKSYAQSRLWTQNEYLRLLQEGAEQAFCTRLPQVGLHGSLAEGLADLPAHVERLALDNYEASVSLSQYPFGQRHCVLAVGAERGWSGAERDLLRGNGFTLASMGERVLKTETACIAGLTLVLEKLGCFN
jgi:16S rRNA (uracil1498-N3)-methyltransferase